MEQQLVVFDPAGESYGINIAAVESIIKMLLLSLSPFSSLQYAPEIEKYLDGKI